MLSCCLLVVEDNQKFCRIICDECTRVDGFCSGLWEESGHTKKDWSLEGDRP